MRACEYSSSKCPCKKHRFLSDVCPTCNSTFRTLQDNPGTKLAVSDDSRKFLTSLGATFKIIYLKGLRKPFRPTIFRGLKPGTKEKLMPYSDDGNDRKKTKTSDKTTEIFRNIRSFQKKALPLYWNKYVRNNLVKRSFCGMVFVSE